MMQNTEHERIIDACQAAQHRISDSGDTTITDFISDPEVMGCVQGVMEQALRHFGNALMSEGMPPIEAMSAAGAMSIAMILRVAFEAGKTFTSIEAQREAALAEIMGLLDPSLAELTGETFTEED